LNPPELAKMLAQKTELRPALNLSKQVEGGSKLLIALSSALKYGL
jgi:hypothetical protein